MKRFIHQIGSLLALLVAINFIYAIVLIKTDWNIKSSVQFFHKNHENIDVLILGNSLGMDGIDAEIMSKESGLNCYNASIEGGNLNDVLYRFQFALKKNRIKMVIIGSNVDYYSDCGELHMVTRGFSKKSYIFQNHLSKYHSFHMGVIKKIISSKHRNSQLVLGQLRYENFYIDNSELEYHDVEVNLGNLACFQSISELAEANDINLIFVNMPLFKNRRQIFYQYPHELNLVNLNGPSIQNLIDSKLHFGSVNHLNKHGAKVITKRLLEEIDDFLPKSNG